MMKSIFALWGIQISSTGGEIGSLEDLYLHPPTWRIEYAVINKEKKHANGKKMIPTDRLFFSNGRGFFYNSSTAESRQCPAAPSETGPAEDLFESMDTPLKSMGEMAMNKIVYDEDRIGIIDDFIVDVVGWKVARIAVVEIDDGKAFERTLILPERVKRMDRS